MSNYFFSVINLKKEMCASVPKTPGVYKWWAKRDILEKLLGKLNLKIDDVLQYLEVVDGYFCIYIGIAKSMQMRLNWHILDKHTKSSVKSGYLSTLRQTLSSIFGADMMDEKTTSEIIDKLSLTYEIVAGDEDCAINKIKEKEKFLLRNNPKLYILNIHGNKHPMAQNAKLRQLRTRAKQLALR